MYARIQSHRSTEDPPPPAGLVTVLADHPGYAGSVFLTDPADARRTLVTLWATRDDAERAPARTAARLGTRPFALDEDLLLEVVGDHAGTAADRAPTAAGLACFDGPLSDAAYAAGERAHRARVTPAWAAVPGTVRLLSLHDPDTRVVRVLNLVVAQDDLLATAQAVHATPLRPDEDPALLTGPDRVLTQRVDAADLPVAAATR